MSIRLKYLALALIALVFLLLLLAKDIGYFHLMWALFWPPLLLSVGGVLAFFFISQGVDTE